MPSLFVEMCYSLSYMAAFSRDDLSARVERLLAELAPELVQKETLHTFLTWLGLVVDWNERVDLTAARDAGELVDLCLADAAVVARETRGTAQSENWIDVGSGLGAPGIALAVLKPAIGITLVEPKTKRVAFLRSVAGTLRLNNVRIQRARSDELDAQSFDVAISRATLPPDEWLAEGARLSRGRVWVLLAKGEVPQLTGWKAGLDISYHWPLTSVARRAIAFDAESPAADGGRNRSWIQ